MSGALLDQVNKLRNKVLMSELLIACIVNEMLKKYDLVAYVPFLPALVLHMYMQYCETYLIPSPIGHNFLILLNRWMYKKGHFVC